MNAKSPPCMAVPYRVGLSIAYNAEWVYKGSCYGNGIPINGYVREIVRLRSENEAVYRAVNNTLRAVGGRDAA